MRKAKAKYLFIAFLFSFFFSFSQEVYFEFMGKAIKNDKPMAGVKVILYKSGVKVAEMVTSKNGQYNYDLDFGYDYKVVFSAPGHIEEYLMIYASKLKESPHLYTYQGETVMWESNDPTINTAHFKNPYTKVIIGKIDKKSEGFRDEEPYFTNFINGIKVDFAKIKREEEERIAADKARKEKEDAEKMKMDAEEKARQEQLMAAQKKALEEAEAQQKMLAEKKRLEDEKLKANEKKENVTQIKEEKTNDENVSENLQLSIEKEQKKIKEKQNKGVKIAYENDLIKMVAENERQMREKEFKQQKAVAYSNEIIETLRKEAELKAKADEVRYNQKQKAKLASLNSQIKNAEVTALIKNVAANERDEKASKMKTYPTLSSFKPKNPVGISTQLEQGKFKSVYTVNVYIDGINVVYRKEKYNWGMMYFYKDNQEIPEQQYRTELSKYKVPL